MSSERRRIVLMIGTAIADTPDVIRRIDAIPLQPSEYARINIPIPTAADASLTAHGPDPSHEDPVIRNQRTTEPKN